MFTIISRILHYGFMNFWRNGWLSTATVIVTVLALLVSVGLMLFGVITNAAVQSVQDKIDISVYFRVDAPEDEILSVKESLEKLSEVKNVSYISRDKALEIFREVKKDDPDIIQGLDLLESNPLEASLNIKAKRPDQYALIAQYLDQEGLKNIVSKLSYEENQKAIDRLTAIINSVNRGGLIASVAMALVAGLVVFNTIRLAIYSSRDEIGIMRVVGAPNSLVRGPFVVDGIIAGFLGAVLSILIALPVVYAVSPWITRIIGELNLFNYMMSNILVLLAYQVLFGVFIGGISSFFAVRRYLRN